MSKFFGRRIKPLLVILGLGAGISFLFSIHRDVGIGATIIAAYVDSIGYIGKRTLIRKIVTQSLAIEVSQYGKRSLTPKALAVVADSCLPTRGCQC